MANLTFRKAGLWTSIQDLGRFGFRKYGVPLSGAMDQQSAQLANLLVNNPANTPMVEITIDGPEIHFDKPTVIALTGANLSPRLNSAKIHLNKPINIVDGDVLTFGLPAYGVRSYLAIKGGFELKPILGSCAMYQSVTKKARFENGDELTYTPTAKEVIQNAAVQVNPVHFFSEMIKVYPGPEFNMITENMRKKLLSEKFKIESNNRMGYQVSNENMLTHDLQIITSPVVPGTVQITPSGKLMILMRDAQVTGGYPRVLQLSESSINRLSQKTTGMNFRFQIVSH